MPTTTGVRKEKSFRESLVRNQVVVPSFQKQQNRYGHSSRTNSTCSESSNCKKKVFIFFAVFALGEKNIYNVHLVLKSGPFLCFKLPIQTFYFSKQATKPNEIRVSQQRRAEAYIRSAENIFLNHEELLISGLGNSKQKKNTFDGKSQYFVQFITNFDAGFLQKKKKKKIVILLKQQPSRINQQKITSLTRII